MSTASTNASICILLARFTKAQFTDDSAYDSLSCPLQDSTILTESRQNFHSSVLVISISALARTMASSSLGTTPGKNNSTCTLPFSWDKGPSKFLPRHGFAFFPPVGQIKKKTIGHKKKQRPTWLQKIGKNIDFLYFCFVISPFFSTSSFCHTAWRWQHPSDAIFTTPTANFPQVARFLQFVKSHGEKKHKKKTILKKHMFTNWSLNMSTVAF